MLHGHNVTVVVTSSYAKAVHPSISIIAECVLSLRWLDLPPATPVLLAHDSPWVGPGARQATPTADASEQFPNAYLEYLARVHHALPRLRMCNGELVPEVTHWVRQQALTRRFPVHRAHLCSSSLPTHLRAP
jgi:hypothetical protein